MTHLEKLQTTLAEVGLPFTVRQGASGDSYLFIGETTDAKGLHWPKDNFETTPIDDLLCRHKFWEFEDGSLVSWSAS